MPYKTGHPTTTIRDNMPTPYSGPLPTSSHTDFPKHFQCQICKLKFVSPSDLQQHEARDHKRHFAPPTSAKVSKLSPQAW